MTNHIKLGMCVYQVSPFRVIQVYQYCLLVYRQPYNVFLVFVILGSRRAGGYRTARVAGYAAAGQHA